MINSTSALGSLGNAQLLAATREVLRRACVVEANLLLHLAEIEQRRLHDEMAFPSMLAFCVGELGFPRTGPTTATRAMRDKLRRAQDLLRHRVPSGGVATVFEKTLDALIEKVEKERFAVGRRPRAAPIASDGPATSRHIPAEIQRRVYSRDGGRCAFVDERGNRCKETGMLEFDHLDGFARTHSHDPRTHRAALSRSQSARRGEDVRPRIHGASARGECGNCRGADRNASSAAVVSSHLCEEDRSAQRVGIARSSWGGTRCVVIGARYFSAAPSPPPPR
jgi:hypothetical protein